MPPLPLLHAFRYVWVALVWNRVDLDHQLLVCVRSLEYCVDWDLLYVE